VNPSDDNATLSPQSIAEDKLNVNKILNLKDKVVSLWLKNLKFSLILMDKAHAVKNPHMRIHHAVAQIPYTDLLFIISTLMANHA
ncbi:hypothetical protein FQN50_002260, partial [Emmonsiellopsis sp. PD_5]